MLPDGSSHWRTCSALCRQACASWAAWMASSGMARARSLERLPGRLQLGGVGVVDEFGRQAAHRCFARSRRERAVLAEQTGGVQRLLVWPGGVRAALSLMRSASVRRAAPWGRL